MMKQLLVIVAVMSLVSSNEFLTFELDLGVGTNPTHYGNPAGGCKDDEQDGSIRGLNGTACLPKCTGVSKDHCPTDTPVGATVPGKCIIRDSTTGTDYCILVC